MQDAPGLDTDRGSADLSDFFRRLRAREPITVDQYEAHFAHQNAHEQTGTPVGVEAPDFELPDQYGNARRRRDLAGEVGLLVVFVRSAHWCPYCRNQLAELGMHADEIRSRGVGLVSISNDSIERLRAFSDEHAIGFPMLSDRTSAVIEQFGVLNRNMDDVPEYPPGVPFPGHFLLSPEGVVVDKAFSGDLRHRPTGTTLVQRHLGSGDDDPFALVETDELTLRIALSASRVFGGQEIGVLVDVAVQPGWHVYGDRVPDPYTGFEVTFERGGLVSGQTLELPEPGSVSYGEGAGTLPVFEGTFRATGTVRTQWRPVLVASLPEEVLEGRVAGGAHVLRGVVRYQACAGETCMMPRSIPFEIPIVIEENVEYAVRARPS